MADSTLIPAQMRRTAAQALPRTPLIVAAAAGIIASAWFVRDERWRAVLLFVALTLGVLSVAITGLAMIHGMRRRACQRAFEMLCRHEAQPAILTDGDGRIQCMNNSAQAMLHGGAPPTIAAFLATYAAAPEEVFAHLARAALCEGRGETVLGGAVRPIGLCATRMEHEGLIWRFSDGAAGLLDPEFALEGPTDMSGVVSESVTDGELAAYSDALPVPILQIAQDGTVARANKRARLLLDDRPVAGLPLANLVEGLGRPIREWLGDAFEARGLHRPEVVRMVFGARELYLQITLGQIETPEGPQLLAVLNDATELKTLEAKFVQSQKMQAIGQLAGGVAHDFNNLLTAISGHCDLLLLRRDEFDPDFADLEQINQNANRAASLVGQLLAFSRKQTLRPEYLDLRHTLADLTHLLNRLVGERVHLSFTHDPALRLIRADKRQLEQVIMNLVVNARDAMPEGGRIQIGTEVESLGQPLRRDRVEVPAGDYVVVRVRDEGSGIHPDRLPKLFEPFYTTKKTGEGTGLGLSTAYGIVKQTGGFIFADSTLGEGSCFSLYFPAHVGSERRRVSSEVREPPAPVTCRDGVVLLVEDEAPVRAFASRALRLRGFTVIEAENGEQALEILQDPSLHIDIFVTDVIMPGLDGPGWVHEARRERPGTRVIFVSGYSEENLVETRAGISNAVFLPKPFSLIQLTETVERQLGSAGPGEER